MRVVQVSTDQLCTPPNFGGAIETYVYGISKELHNLGPEVHLVGLAENWGEFQKEGVIFHPFTLQRSWTKAFHLFTLNGGWAKALGPLYKLVNPWNRTLLCSTINIVQILRRIQEAYGSIDVIHCHYLSTSFAPIIYKKLHAPNVKLVLHWHNEPKTNCIENYIDRWVTSKYDLNACVSIFIKKKILQLLNVCERKTKVIHNGVDTDFFNFDKKKRTIYRRKLGLSNDYVILYIGRIVRQKGLLVLIKALPNVLKEAPNVHLLIVGGGFRKERDYYEEVNEEIKELGIEDKVVHLGKVPFEELPFLYAASDLVVVPSIWQDPCPSVVIEAMSCNRRVVSFCVGGIPEIVPNEKFGGLVSSKDDLSDAILGELLSRNNFTGDIRKRAVDKFSWFAAARDLKKLYLQLMEMHACILHKR